MAKQCTHPKRPRNSAWFKEKLMLVEAQEAGQILDEEQLAFIADHGIAEVQVAQQIIPQNSAFQTEDLDAYDLDYVLSEVPYSDTYLNDMINQDVQEMPYSEQTHIVDFPDNEITNSQMDGLIRNRNAKFAAFQQEIYTLKETLSNQVKEKESLSTTLTSHTPVRIEAPSEIPKVSLVNESLKKLKYHLASFDKVVKKRTTSDAISAKEITEVQTVFNQIEAAVNQCSVDKNAFEIQIKQLSIDNDQLLKQIMSQEIVHITVNSVDILNMNKSCVDECNKCLEPETELLKKKDLIEKDVYDKLLKSYSTLEKHCISWN
ncbi:hypothetical protein Tco_1247069 [Tanacetum coccineum]